jgi:hypothetical protein
MHIPKTYKNEKKPPFFTVEYINSYTMVKYIRIIYPYSKKGGFLFVFLFCFFFLFFCFCFVFSFCFFVLFFICIIRFVSSVNQRIIDKESVEVVEQVNCENTRATTERRLLHHIAIIQPQFR